MEAAEPWRIHDLRRTAVTGMAELGVMPHVIEAVVNHISGHKGGVAGVYNRAVYAAEKKAALELWADHVSSVVGGPAMNTLRNKSAKESRRRTLRERIIDKMPTSWTEMDIEHHGQPVGGDLIFGRPSSGIS